MKLRKSACIRGGSCERGFALCASLSVEERVPAHQDPGGLLLLCVGSAGPHVLPRQELCSDGPGHVHRHQVSPTHSHMISSRSTRVDPSPKHEPLTSQSITSSLRLGSTCFLLLLSFPFLSFPFLSSPPISSSSPFLSSYHLLSPPFNSSPLFSFPFHLSFSSPLLLQSCPLFYSIMYIIYTILLFSPHLSSCQQSYILLLDVNIFNDDDYSVSYCTSCHLLPQYFPWCLWATAL